MKNYVLFTLASIGMLASTQQSFGQAPSLGATVSYGLFTASGNLVNTGSTTLITGDIGTDLGTVTGFTTGTYTGTMQIQNTPSSDAAKGVNGAYTDLDNIVTGTAHGTSLGSETLTPGVYLLGATSTLTGQLILDGQADANALFIIKVNGALLTAASSNVKLINSASWQNVYWQINGQMTIGINARFNGTIVGSGDISLLNNAVLQGRALTKAGLISTNSSQVTTSPTPLPVELTRFTAESRGENALLHWATASERNNAYFAVQSSTDGFKYATIGKVEGHGNTSSPQTYTWNDTRLGRYPVGTVYYRLLQVDTDSAKHYSPVRTITTAQAGGLLQVQAYPSPSRSLCSLHIDTNQAGPATLRLTNALGHVVAERQYLLEMGSNALPLEEATTLAPGIYLVQVEQGTVRQTIRLVRE